MLSYRTLTFPTRSQDSADKGDEPNCPLWTTADPPCPVFILGTAETNSINSLSLFLVAVPPVSAGGDFFTLFSMRL